MRVVAFTEPVQCVCRGERGDALQLCLHSRKHSKVRLASPGERSSYLSLAEGGTVVDLVTARALAYGNATAVHAHLLQRKKRRL